MSAESEKKVTQNPWVLLVEKVSANGDRRELDIAAFSTNNGIKDFLNGEAKRVGQSMQELERKIIASRRRPSGKLRRLSEVSPIKEEIQGNIDKMKRDLDVLKGVERQPIKIMMIGEQVVDWERATGVEDEWARYVGDEHPEILGFSLEERNWLQRVFMYKYAVKHGERVTIEDYEILLHEIRDSGSQDKLTTYRDEISQRFSRR